MPFIHCRPSVGDKVQWAEERARLNHNLLSLRQALQDREIQAEADEAATSSRLKASQDDNDRSARERVSLRETVHSLRVELAEALLLAAAAKREGSVSVGTDGVRERDDAQDGKASSCSSVVSRDGDAPVEEVGVGGVDEGRLDGGACGEESPRTGAQEPGPELEPELAPDTGEGSRQGADNGGRSAVTGEGRGGEAAQVGPDHRVVGSIGRDAAAAGSRTRDRWLDGDFEGTIGDNLFRLFTPSGGVRSGCKPLRVERW